MQILQLDIQGYPQDWISPQQASTYYATDSISWTVGEVCTSLRGGTNAMTGLQSRIDVHPIIAVNGASKTNLLAVTPGMNNQKLFMRDRNTCGYCGSIFNQGSRRLTRDHIYPKGKGGENSWSNCISACVSCNHRKACRSPEEAKMPLIFLPYVPRSTRIFCYPAGIFLVMCMTGWQVGCPSNPGGTCTEACIKGSLLLIACK